MSDYLTGSVGSPNTTLNPSKGHGQLFTGLITYNPDDLIFTPVLGGEQAYSSAIEFIYWLVESRTPGHAELHTALEHFLKAAGIEVSDFAAGKSTSSDAGVAFAVLRRISRESAYLAAPLLRLVRACCDSLSRWATRRRLVIKDFDRMDRSSIKFFCSLFLNVGDSISWAVSVHYLSITESKDFCLYKAAKRDILLKVIEILAPRITRPAQTQAPFPVPDSFGTAIEIAGNIVLQNYDICLTRRPQHSAAAETCDIRRLQALAAVNVRLYESALALLREGMKIAERPSQLAMCMYASGLIYQKRLLDPSSAVQSYYAGLRFTDGVSSADDPTVDLERAWLFNGLALADAIQAKTVPSAPHPSIANAFEKLTIARTLIKEDKSDAASYLRHNLIANIVLLAEIDNRFTEARMIFEKHFISTDKVLSLQASAQKTTFAYRLALLKWRENDIDVASRLIQAAEHSARAVGCDFSLERILRASAALSDIRGDSSAAIEKNEEGVLVAKSIYSVDGLRHHAGELCRIFHTKNDATSVRKITSDCMILGINIPIMSIRRPVPPKLPAYFPELDFEDVPARDLNQWLAGV